MSDVAWDEFRERWAPAIDTSLKLAAAIWVVMSLLSSFALNDYLSVIGQTGLPMDFTGTWAIFFMFGGVIVLLLLSLGVPVMVVRHLLQKEGLLNGVRPICRDMVWLWSGVGLSLFAISLPTIEQALEWWWTLLFVGALPCVLKVLWRLCRHPWPATWSERWGLLGLWLLFLGMTAVPFFELFWAMHLVLGQMASSGYDFFGVPSDLWGAILVAYLVTVICLLSPIVSAIPVVLLLLVSLILFVSPRPVGLMQIALFSSNLGGGRPAQAITSKVSAGICNLGTASRPVLYVADEGCTKLAALKHLRKLIAEQDPLARADLLHKWQADVREIAPQEYAGAMGAKPIR